MTREQMAKEIEYILKKMQDYQWKSAYEETTNLYKRVTETPRDIQWDEERINMIGRNGNTGLHYE